MLISTPWEHTKHTKPCKRLLTRLLQRRQSSIHRGDKRAYTRKEKQQHIQREGETKISAYTENFTSNLPQRGTQEQLRGETENRRWSEREKQKERKKQSFEGGVRERKREIDLCRLSLTFWHCLSDNFETEERERESERERDIPIDTFDYPY